jgi:hypothetical protein
MKVVDLLQVSGQNTLRFRIKPSVNLDYFKKTLESDSWKKVLDEEEEEEFLYGNFIVIYKKGNYEITLFCDPDGCVNEFEITKTATSP